MLYMNLSARVLFTCLTFLGEIWKPVMGPPFIYHKIPVMTQCMNTMWSLRRALTESCTENLCKGCTIVQFQGLHNSVHVILAVICFKISGHLLLIRLWVL